MTCVASALQNHLSRITHLDLSKNHIGNEGIATIAQVVASSSTIVELMLSHNLFGDTGLYCLSDALW